MKVVKSWMDVTSRGRVVLAAGFFDGMHAGHRRVIERAVEAARRAQAEPWSLTFDRHPLKVLCPDKAPPLLTSNRHRLRLLEQAGMAGCVMMPFTRSLARLTPDVFVDRLCQHVPGLVEMVIGSNWRFGRGGEGNTACLARLGRTLGFRVTRVRPVVRQGRIASSTRIRSSVRRGRLREAAGFLGRTFSVLGTVIRGRTVGRRLGYPTANIRYENEVLPPQGVYAVRAAVACVGRQKETSLRDGVLNLGMRPTYGPRATRTPALELHLFDQVDDLYGRDVEVFFIERMRSERRFASEKELKDQIRRDVAMAETRLTKKREDSLYTRCLSVL